MYITNFGGWWKNGKPEIHIEIDDWAVVVLDKNAIDYLRPWLEEYFAQSPKEVS